MRLGRPYTTANSNRTHGLDCDYLYLDGVFLSTGGADATGFIFLRMRYVSHARVRDATHLCNSSFSPQTGTTFLDPPWVGT